MKPTVLGVVTARAGSKGLPGKNTRLLGGRPLIAYTIDAARRSGVFDRIVLSTDDAAAAEIGRASGCEVPFVRPAELSADDTPHLPVMQHAVSWLRDHDRYLAEWTMILMPTSPFRGAVHIAAAVDRAIATGADSVVSVERVPTHYSPERALSVDADGWTRLFIGNQPVRNRPVRRQDLRPSWTFSGAIYLFRTSLLFAADPSLYGDRVAAYEMPPPSGLNIDDEEDWAAAERWLARGG
jgi:CMP-N-acetylneuraminic acid synthetase